jgi:ligand-binding sensor domain-containing protein
LRYSLLLVKTLFPVFLFAQEYSYVQYNVKDGLAGATVYDLCQDKDGFIWFATDAGVSRFDGTHFRNFTLDDGLPSIEILKIFADSRGRVWMAPFKKTLCYYYKGRIFTPENDSLLKPVILDDFVHGFAEDINGDLLISSVRNITVLRNGDKADNFYMKNFFVSANNYPNKGFLIATTDSIFKLDDKGINFWQLTSKNDNKNFSIYFPDSSVLNLERKMGIISLYIEKSKLLFVNTEKGSWEVDTLNLKYKRLHLEGKAVTHTLTDNENNIWFATLGHGVYKLISREFISFSFNSPEPAIYSLEKWNNSIVAGTNFKLLYSLSGLKTHTIRLGQNLKKSPGYSERNRVYCLKRIQSGDLVVTLDDMIVCLSPDGRVKATNETSGIKSLHEISNSILLVGTNKNVVLMKASDLATIDTIWHGRSTAVSYVNNDFYIGTNDGLFVLQKNKIFLPLADQIPALNSPISQIIQAGDSIVWVATNGKGVVGLKNKKLLVSFNSLNGLTSNVCRSLFLQNNFLWVGTDKGINKIDISDPKFTVTHYSTADGLSSNIINVIYVDNDTVYVGSPAGLTLFNEKKVIKESKSNLKILAVRIANRSLSIDSAYTADYGENNIKLDYTCISFRSEGDILYKYRLKGLNDIWDSTRSTSLEYPSLPSGKFEFELLAINKFGITSNLVTVRFLIKPPFWQTTWFRIVVITGIAALIWLFATLLFNKFRKKEQEKMAVRQKLNELEQKAMRAQMNPHFIFNCLSSIQGFIINKDFETTNNYLTEFASLIRQTLDHSETTYITIESEIKYLRSYLEMEKMRYGNLFKYSIEVDTGVNQDFTYIPSMLLQPFIENSIRHGLRYRNDELGLIQVKFRQTDKDLYCIVQDNGIGRKKAAEYKSQINIVYQSRGMRLIEERINILNKIYAETIRTEIIDMLNDDGEPAGTKITIYFPLNLSKN